MTWHKIIIGDCFEAMKDLPDESVDLVLTDPPYGLNKKEIIGDMDLEVYYNSIPDIRRLLKPNSFFATFTSIKNLPKMFKIPLEYSWIEVVYYRNMQRIVPSPLGRSKISLMIIFKKGNPKRHKHIWDVQEFLYNGKDLNLHPGAKPEEPLKNIIECLSNKGDTILDPFAGSFTTAKVAKDLGRNSISIEINPEYWEKIGRKRLQVDTPSLDNSVKFEVIYLDKMKMLEG